MYTLYWKSQSNHAHQEEHFDDIEETVREFRMALTGLYAHNGGDAGIVNEENNDMSLIEWIEGASGGYCVGQSVIDYKPEENLEECPNEGCAWHDEDSQELCEECEQKVLEICLDWILRDYQ